MIIFVLLVNYFVFSDAQAILDPNNFVAECADCAKFVICVKKNPLAVHEVVGKLKLETLQLITDECVPLLGDYPSLKEKLEDPKAFGLSTTWADLLPPYWCDEKFKDTLENLKKCVAMTILKKLSECELQSEKTSECQGVENSMHKVMELQAKECPTLVVKKKR